MACLIFFKTVKHDCGNILRGCLLYAYQYWHFRNEVSDATKVMLCNHNLCEQKLLLFYCITTFNQSRTVTEYIYLSNCT